MTTAPTSTRRPPVRQRPVPAPAPARRRRIDLRHPVTAATLLSAVLHLVWALWLFREGGDLAAQAAWTDFAGEHPDAAYNMAWYGGMHPASYSVLSPYLMSWFGIRTVAVIAGTLTATLTAMLLVRLRAPIPLATALWATVALWCNAASGRVTFGLGLVFALVAVTAAFTPRGTPALRAATMLVGGVLATLASPVAGLFLLVVAAALFLTGRRRAGVMLALGMPLVVGVTTLLFPFDGVQPIGFASIVLPTITSVVAVLFCAPRTWTVLRVGAAVYLVGVFLTFFIPSPVGSNVERLSLLFGGAVLMAVAAHLVQRHGWRTQRLRLSVLGAAFLVTAGWMVFKPAQDLVHTRPAATSDAHSQALIAELDRRGARQSRIEVVPLRSHWESAGLARHFALARGWNRQVDAERNALFYEDNALTPASYNTWLHTWAVRYVVLPEQEVDWSSHAEAALVRAGQPYLKQIWNDRYWRLYEVESPTSLVTPPATVAKLDAGELTVDVPAKGSTLLRISYSPWLGVHSGPKGACLKREGDFVRLEAPSPGRYKIAATYTLPRGTPCH